MKILSSTALCLTFISDHFSVHWLPRAHRPSRPTNSVQFKKLKSIDHSSFCSDLANLPLVINTADDCESILHQYDIGLTSTLDRHAPVIKSTFTVRPENLWDSENIHAARRYVRNLEALEGGRRAGRCRLSIDKELMHHALHSLREKIYHTKSLSLNSQIVKNRVKKSLLKLVDSLLLVKPSLRLPNPDVLTERVERFSTFFISKITSIRSDFDTVKQKTELLSLDAEVLNNFRPISPLSFFSILLERVVAHQLVHHYGSESLFVPDQSAYRSSHLTETALLKVFKPFAKAILQS